MNLKDVTCIVVENGLFVSFAERLARDFGRVCHFCPYVSAFPTRHLAQIGEGLEGVERIKDFWDFVDEQKDHKATTLFVFLDIHFGDFQNHLRNEGWLCWGSGDAEDMELFRHDFKSMLKTLKLDVGPHVLVKGLPALREHLKNHKNVWVKISEFRGINETFESKNYDAIKAKLDDLQNDMGPMVDDQEFIVEEHIDTTGEVGYDGFNINGEFPPQAAMGYELKDRAYLGVMLPYDKLPKPVLKVNEGLKPALKAYGCKGFISTEIRTKDDKAYCVDMTMRLPSPPGAAYQEWWTNISEILWGGANGRIVPIKYEYTYAFVILLVSEFAANNWLNVQYPKEIARYVKLYNKTVIKGQVSIVPTDAKLVQIGEVLGFGNTIEEAAKQALSNAEQIVADGIKVDKESIGALFKTVKESIEQGVYFGDSEIPDKI